MSAQILPMYITCIFSKEPLLAKMCIISRFKHSMIVLQASKSKSSQYLFVQSFVSPLKALYCPKEIIISSILSTSLWCCSSHRNQQCPTHELLWISISDPLFLFTNRPLQVLYALVPIVENTHVFSHQSELLQLAKLISSTHNS